MGVDRRPAMPNHLAGISQEFLGAFRIRNPLCDCPQTNHGT